jgi:hypothetical protein
LAVSLSGNITRVHPTVMASEASTKNQRHDIDIMFWNSAGPYAWVPLFIAPRDA